MSVCSVSSTELLALHEARPVHARWSELNGEFLDWVAQNPEYLERDTFASLSAESWLRVFSLQSWPLFVGQAQRRELEAVALGMDRLMKGTLERFLGGDLARVRDFYRFDPASEDRTPRRAIFTHEPVLPMLLREPTGLRGARTRGDYLETPDGLKCMEFNGGFLGGTQLDGMGALYLACPPIARFLEAKGRRAHAPQTLAADFRHLVDETVRLGAWTGGDFNVALVLRPNADEWAALFVEETYAAALQRVLDERGIPGGRLFICGVDDFHEAFGTVFIDGHPIHLVIDHHDGTIPLRLQFKLFKMGRINFVSGPIGHILSDKGNLALISENADSDEYTAQERALIERHVPWTRRVRAAQTTFRGRGFRLPDDLAERRAEFVLKKSCSIGGSDVVVGRFRSDAEWRADLARAAREQDWIVQEYLESVPFCFQAGERGAVRHDMVWGLFAFGDHFGGAFTRMMPRSDRGGVVNSAQGAQVGLCLELED